MGPIGDNSATDSHPGRLLYKGIFAAPAKRSPGILRLTSFADLSVFARSTAKIMLLGPYCVAPEPLQALRPCYATPEPHLVRPPPRAKPSAPAPHPPVEVSITSDADTRGQASTGSLLRRPPDVALSSLTDSISPSPSRLRCHLRVSQIRRAAIPRKAATTSTGRRLLLVRPFDATSASRSARLFAAPCV